MTITAIRGFNDVFSKDGAAHRRIEDAARAVKQALGMIEDGYVTSLSGKPVPVAADTLCLHGDQPGAAVFAVALRRAFKEKNISVAAP